MSLRLSAFRVALLTVTAMCWAAACGSGDTSVSTSLKQCNIYPGGGIVPDAPDGPSLCPKGACNFQTQVGCSTGQTCSPHYDAASDSIVPACLRSGTQTRGEPCDNSANQICAPGLICANGKCAKPCCAGDWTACDNGESCIRSATKFMTTSGAVIPYDQGLGTCAPVGTCDALDPKSCAGDSDRPVCRIVDPRGFTACQQHSDGGDAQLGETCSAGKQCAAGLHCAGNIEDDASTKTVCVRLCAWGSCDREPSCGPGEGTCVHFIRDPDGVGECTPRWRGEGIPIDGGVPPGPGSADAASKD